MGCKKDNSRTILGVDIWLYQGILLWLLLRPFYTANTCSLASPEIVAVAHIPIPRALGAVLTMLLEGPVQVPHRIKKMTYHLWL